MIDGKDPSNSRLRFVLWKELQKYSTKELIEFLDGNETILKTSAAKSLHFRPTQEVFEAAIKLSLSRKSDNREIGAFVLGQLGTPKMPFRDLSVPILIPLLSSDKVAKVRAAAAAALGHLHAVEASSELQYAISDSSALVRSMVAFALGFLPSEKHTIDALCQLAKDKDESVREWASLSLHSVLNES